MTSLALTDTQTLEIYPRVSVNEADAWQFLAWQFRFVERAGEDTEARGEIRLRRLTECKCVGIVHTLQVEEHARRRGIGRTLVQKLEQTAKAQGITLLMCTIRVDNMASRALFQSLGYTAISEMRNPASGNDLLMYRKEVR